MVIVYHEAQMVIRDERAECGPTACALAAAPARATSISRESVLQKTNDLARTGRGGRLHARVRRQPWSHLGSRAFEPDCPGRGCLMFIGIIAGRHIKRLDIARVAFAQSSLGKAAAH